MIKKQPVSKLSDLLRRMLQLSKSYEYAFKKSVNIQSNFNLLGKPIQRQLIEKEMIAIEKLLFKTEAIAETDGCKVALSMEQMEQWSMSFSRLSHSYGTIFTTTSYTRSRKRINYCALLIDGRLVFIDSFIFLKSDQNI